MVTSSSLPISLVVGPGNEHDSKRFEQTVGSIRINIGRGRPRNKPKEVLADAAYDIETIRVYLRKRGIKCCIPENNVIKKRLLKEGQRDLTMSHTRNEAQLSDSLDGLSQDSEGLLQGTRDSMIASWASFVWPHFS